MDERRAMNISLLLTDLRRDAEENRDTVHALVADFSADELVLRPDADSWSIAQCLEHLYLTGEAYHPRVEEVLRKGKAGAASYRPSLFGRIFHALGGPKVRIPLKAHGRFQPSPDPSRDVPHRLIAQQAELIDLLSRADGADLRARVPAPHSRILSLQLGETLIMLVRHQRRHIAQAQRVGAAIRNSSL